MSAMSSATLVTYLVGGGSMPSIGTSNITLTIAALCFRSAKHIVEQIRKETAPRELART